MQEFNGADMTFVIISAALVMLMIPGLALFYGGMVKSTNVLSTTLHSYAALVLISVQWLFIGYSLAFGPDIGGVIGSLDWAFLRNVDLISGSSYAPAIPHLLFAAFQMMFLYHHRRRYIGSICRTYEISCIHPVCSVVEHFCLCPNCALGVGRRRLAKKPWHRRLCRRFVVEINSGVSGLVAAIMIGRRRKTTPDPHHLPMAILGAGLLWFGWFGFNAGSTLAINGVAVNAFLTTNTSAAAGAIGFVACEWVYSKKPTALGTLCGAIAGLVAITQGAGFVTPMASFFIGLLGGTFSFFAIAF